jgi:hypothetical protein
VGAVTGRGSYCTRAASRRGSSRVRTATSRRISVGVVVVVVVFWGLF